jgi:predicted amidophosphoribosyltransferase
MGPPRIHALVRQAIALVAPPRCAICGRDCGVDESACAACVVAINAAAPLRFSLPGVDDAFSVAAHEGVVRRLVVALKFARRPSLADLAAPQLAAALPGELELDAAVPVPPAPLRLARRGFDPADALAASVARELGLPLAICLRRRHGPRQVGRPRSARLADPPRVEATGPAPAAPLLVDDVVTTGATLTACAEELRRAGAARVYAVTVARALGPRPGRA